MSAPKTVSVWIGAGHWVTIPCGTPTRPLTDGELRAANAILSSAHEDLLRSRDDVQEERTVNPDAKR